MQALASRFVTAPSRQLHTGDKPGAAAVGTASQAGGVVSLQVDACAAGELMPQQKDPIQPGRTDVGWGSRPPVAPRTWFQQRVHQCTAVRVAHACVRNVSRVHATPPGLPGGEEALPLPRLCREKSVPGFFVFLTHLRLLVDLN